VLALLILATILGRNLVKLYFERKSGQVEFFINDKKVGEMDITATVYGAYTGAAFLKWAFIPLNRLFNSALRDFQDTQRNSAEKLSILPG
jgi:hypothetical protein